MRRKRQRRAREGENGEREKEGGEEVEKEYSGFSPLSPSSCSVGFLLLLFLRRRRRRCRHSFRRRRRRRQLSLPPTHICMCYTHNYLQGDHRNQKTIPLDPAKSQPVTAEYYQRFLSCTVGTPCLEFNSWKRLEKVPSPPDPAPSLRPTVSPPACPEIPLFVFLLFVRSVGLSAQNRKCRDGTGGGGDRRRSNESLVALHTLATKRRRSASYSPFRKKSPFSFPRSFVARKSERRRRKGDTL